MSIENQQLREQLEEKYNINLDIQTEVGEKTYWDLPYKPSKDPLEFGSPRSRFVDSPACSPSTFGRVREVEVYF